MKMMMITVMGKDRPGIIARITGILYAHGANLEDISMTILEDEFAMMCIAGLKRPTSEAKLLDRLQGLEKKEGLSVFWKSLNHKPLRYRKHQVSSDAYVVSVIGRDKMGMVYAVSRELAQLQLNITDLNCKLLGRGKKSVYAMLLEVDVPVRFSIKRLERVLNQIGRKLSAEVRFHPVERCQF